MSNTSVKQLRLSEKNSINSRLIELRSFLKNKKRTIMRFTQNNINLTKIPQLKKEIEELENDIKNLEERFASVNIGNLDTELLENAKKNIKEVQEKNALKKKKKEIIEKDKEDRKKKSMEYYNKTMKIKREQRYEDKNKNYYQKHFFKVVDSIPEYLIKKLNNMPNNKGYIFRDVYLYGKLPCDNTNTTTLFETKNKVKYIHEWNRNKQMYTLYENVYRGKNIVIERRKIKTNKKEINII